ncbi:MAG: chemotaxis protein CheW [Lachnospiraceae bacterium]|nr:chemotaxis protein CheW [Lachnospiraceae bacterium]
MAETKYIVFLINEQKYCIDLSKIKGIESDYQVVRIPSSADFIRGIIHLRNEIVPIYDLKERFEQENDYSGKTVQLLVTETHNLKLGIEVDDVVGIVGVEEDDIKSVPGVVTTDDTNYLESVIRIESERKGHKDIILCISVDRLITDEEAEVLEELIEEENSQE